MHDMAQGTDRSQGANIVSNWALYILLDFAKAFDNVSHLDLIYKYIINGIRDTTIPTSG